MPALPLPTTAETRTTIRVAIVDDNVAFRESLENLLADDGFEVVGCASTGADALRLVDEVHPDVVLMDVRMPGMDGIEATRQLKALRPHIEIVALTGLEEQRSVREMLVAGASGYVLKDSDADDIVQAIHHAAQGGAVLSPDITPQVIEELTEALDRERRRAAQLEHAQEALLERAARRQELISRLGHELRTPVTVILGMAQTLRSGAAAPEEREELLDVLHSRAQSLATLVQRLEAVVQVGLTERADVADIAHEVAAQNPRVSVESPPAGVAADINRVAARRILEELVGNALAFSPEERSVIVDIRARGDVAEIRVVDRGDGVDPAIQARIFDPLEQGEELNTRRHQGIGLGLTLARMSARVMDGDVVLESTGPAGSTFLWTIGSFAPIESADTPRD
jgi:signal transduction histidine kinase